MKNRNIVGLCALIAAAPLLSAEQTIEERLANLESIVSTLAAENASLKKELGYSKEGVAPVFVLPAGKEKKLVLGGFIHGNAEFGDAPDSRWSGTSNRFFIRRARVNLTSTFAEGFLAKIEMDVGANTLSAGSSYRAQMTDGYLQWSKYPQAVIRLGQFKTPFGYEQLTSDTKVFTVERSLPNDRLTVSRQIGLGLSGDFFDKKLSYSLGAFNGTGVNTGANDNDEMMWVGRLSGEVYSGKLSNGLKTSWNVGANAYTNEATGSFTGRREGLGIDTQLVLGQAEFWAEWLQRRESPTVGGSSKADGYSILGVWKFNPQFQGVVRFESYDSNTDTPNTTTDLWTLGFNYLIKGNDIKLSVDYLIGDQAGTSNKGERLLTRMQLMF